MKRSGFYSRYTEEERMEAVKRWLHGPESQREVATAYGIGVSTLSKWIGIYRASNGLFTSPAAHYAHWDVKPMPEEPQHETPDDGEDYNSYLTQIEQEQADQQPDDHPF